MFNYKVFKLYKTKISPCMSIADVTNGMPAEQMGVNLRISFFSVSNVIIEPVKYNANVNLFWKRTKKI